MSERTEKISIHASLSGLEGCGDELRWLIRGHRRMKNGRYVNYEITLTTCRFGATRVLRELKDMHKRDRARIDSELATIESERTELTK